MSQDLFLDSATAYPISNFRRIRLWVVRFLKGALITWLGTLLIAFQAYNYDANDPAPHPIQRLLDAGSVQVDMTSITVVSQLAHNPSYEMGAWKRLLQGVTGVLASSSYDAPTGWELVAEERDGYRSLRYEGRGSRGTHWVITAYQMGLSDAIYVTLRTELRDFPQDLRLTAYELRQQLEYGVAQPLKHHDTRIVISGRTNAHFGRTLSAFGEGLLQTLGSADALRVKEESGTTWVSGYSPYLVRSGSLPTNVEMQLIPEGEYTRITLGTPYLGSVESSVSSGYPLTHTSLASGQTIHVR